jgi:hypothetical protein
MTDVDSFSSSDEVNPPASGAESTSVNSQDDVSTEPGERVNLTQESVNPRIPLTRSAAPGATGWLDGDGTFLLGPYQGTRMVDWALAYAERGWHVFQMRPGTKGFFANCPRCREGGDRYEADAHTSGKDSCTAHPEGYGKCHGLWSATRNPDVIRQWWTDNPHANIGINCGMSGIACVDVDIKHHQGKYGDRSIQSLEATYEPFPLGPRAVTASGGWHWIFALPDGHELRSSTGSTDAKGRKHGLADHVDIKAVGGLMVATPSLVYDDTKGEVTGQYQWDPTGGQTIPDLPTWVVGEIEKREARPKPAPSVALPFGPRPDADRDEVLTRVNELADEVASAGQGGRNETLLRNARMAFQYAEAGQIPHREVEFIFEQASRVCGLDDSEIPRTITNARNYATGKPRAWAARIKPEQAQAQYDQWKNVPAPRPAPDVQVEQVEQDARPTPEPEQEVEEEFESRDAFAERMNRIDDPNVRKNEARRRVKQLAHKGAGEEERQEERDFLKATCKLTAGDFKSLYATAHRDATRATPDGSDGRPVYVMGDELREYSNLVELIENGVFPETYVRDGKLVHVQPVSGVRVAKGKINTSTYQAKDITPPTLRRLVATYTIPYRQTEKGTDSPLPTRALCESILDNPEWDGVDTLHGLIDAPFVRADGTICQDHGFDRATGMWLALPSGYVPVPDNPTGEDVKSALDLLMNQVLRDFPFASTADRANAVGMLFTPMIRNITNCPVPLQLISAHTAGTGKTLLAQLATAAHGGGDYTFPRNSDEELRKTVTSILMDQASPVVNFDNIATGSTIDSPALAALLTMEVWKDRVLGGNTTVTLPNDKMWIATGNNLKVNTDISTRTVLIQLDAGTENPDERPVESFCLGDMLQWIGEAENRAALVRSLLILIRSWAAAGMPKGNQTMRTFTPWAQAVGGLLAHHGIHDFLGNREAVKDTDEDKQQDALFLQKWTELVGDEWLSASDLITKYQTMDQARYTTFTGGIGMDQWQGSFPVRQNGRPYSAVGFGKWLGARKDTPRHGFVLRWRKNPTTNSSEWRAERLEQAGESAPEQQGFFEPHRT